MHTPCPYCNSTICNYACNEADTARQQRITQYEHQRDQATLRLQRMEAGDLQAFDEEFEALQNHPLRYSKNRVAGDQLDRRVNIVIDLADKLPDGREVARKFRGIP